MVPMNRNSGKHMLFPTEVVERHYLLFELPMFYKLVKFCAVELVKLLSNVSLLVSSIRTLKSDLDHCLRMFLVNI